jgi:hypothetical protein
VKHPLKLTRYTAHCRAPALVQSLNTYLALPARPFAEAWRLSHSFTFNQPPTFTRQSQSVNQSYINSAIHLVIQLISHSVSE